MEYKISVVIPFYNCEKCIKRAIDSVLNQNRNDVLIILSDDGSTDKSIKICEKYVQKYQNIKLIKAANSGPSGARNRGIDAAEGDYIIFLDADDEFSTGYIDGLTQIDHERQMAICARVMQYSAKPAVAVNVPKKLISIGEFIKGSLKGDISPIVAFTGPVNRMYSLKLIKENGLKFDTSYRYGEDTLFNLEYLFLTKNISLTDGCYICHETNGSLSKRFSANKYKCYPRLKQQMSKLISTYCNNDKDVLLSRARYWTDNFFARCHEVLDSAMDKREKAANLDFIVKSGIVSKDDILTARGSKFAFVLLSDIVKIKSGKLLFWWFVIAPKIGV